MDDLPRARPDAALPGQAVLDAVNAQVAVLDRRGVIVSVNEPWRRFALENGAEASGPASRTGVGVNYLEICDAARGENAQEAGEVGEGIRAVLDGRIPRFSREYPCPAPDRPRWFVLTVLPLGEAEGGAVVSHTDITAARETAQALGVANERLARAQKAAGAGMWDWDIPGGELRWSAELFRLFGLDPERDEAGMQAWQRVVHPQDMEAAEQRIQTAIAERLPLDTEYRIVLPSGEARWINALGDTVYGPDGRPVCMSGICLDITSRKRAEDALVEASQRKDEFLAMLAHELRNPLAPIRNAAHVLGRLHLNEPRVRWAQQVIEQQVAHLARLVDDLLDVSRIERGRVGLRMAPIALSGLVRDAVEAARPALEDKGHRLDVTLPEDEVVLLGDAVRLAQVLVNLLDNAAKYTPHGGHVRLQARRREGWLEISVEDDGMGIPADLLPGVFDLFRQGERTLDRAQGGLGIGLTLVQRLVELHGGRVAAHSPGPGRGATFSLRLPLPASPPQARPEPPPGPPATQSSRRVLIVDDEPVVAESTALFLQMEGHDVRTAGTGEAALALLGSFRPQVVLLDIGLPGQDGFQVAGRIRRLPGGWDLHLVAMSGYGQEEVLHRCRDAGFDQHLVKPVDPEALCAACLAGGRVPDPGAGPEA